MMFYLIPPCAKLLQVLLRTGTITLESEMLYRLDGKYHTILDRYGVNTGRALKEIGLPEDFLESEEPAMTVTQYYRFIDAIGKQRPPAEVAIDAAKSELAIKQSPEIYAAYQSQNARQCIRRIGMYKQILGLVRYHIEETKDHMCIELSLADGTDIPVFLAEFEFCFLLNLIRRATGKSVRPERVSIFGERSIPAIENFLGRRLEGDGKTFICLSKSNIEFPFRFNDEREWMKYEPEIFCRMYGLENKGEFIRSLQYALIHLLPTGTVTLDGVARELNISRRTLQRRLNDRNTSYREELDDVRLHMSEYFLKNSESSVETIAYALAYMEHNSFSRAFRKWTGMTTTEYRRHNAGHLTG